MSDDSWPTGPGRTESTFDPAVDGTPTKGAGVRKEPGRVERSGSRRSPSVYDHWLDIMEPMSFGKRMRITVDRPRFNANVKKIRDQLDPSGEQRDATNAIIVEGFRAFAAAVGSDQLNMDGRNAWSTFMGLWQKWVAGAPSKKKPETTVEGGAWYL